MVFIYCLYKSTATVMYYSTKAYVPLYNVLYTQHHKLFTTVTDLNEAYTVWYVATLFKLRVITDKFRVCSPSKCNETLWTGTVKVKVKLPLCLIKHYAMTPWRSRSWFHTFLILKLYGGDWSASRPACFTPGKEPTLPTEMGASWALQLIQLLWKTANLIPQMAHH